MQGVSTFLGPQSVEQELLLLGHSHPAELDRTSGRNAHRFALPSGFFMRIYAAVFAVAAIMWLIMLAWRCLFSRSRGWSSGHRWRRLASGGGKQGEGEGEENPQACENLEEVLPGLEREDSASNPPPPQPTGPSAAAAADEEQPRKKKQKTKRLTEDPEETSEDQAKRARLEEWSTDPLQNLEILFSLEETNPGSLPAPPVRPQPEEPEFDELLEILLTKGETRLADWFRDPEEDAPLATEEQHRPEGSADSSPLEGTSSAFPYFPPSQAMESQGPQEPAEDTEMPSTSSATSGIQLLSSQPSLPQRGEAPEPPSLLEASAAPSGETPLIPFDPHTRGQYVRSGGLARKLEPLERLLRKEYLSSADKQAIIYHSKTLFIYVKARLCQVPTREQAHRLLPMAVNRLLVMEALWRACERVGSAMNKQEWWKEFVSALYGNEMWWTLPPQRGSYPLILLERTCEAMKSFMQGRHPGQKEWAELFRAFFDKKTGLQALSGSEWDLWREEDEDS